MCNATNTSLLRRQILMGGISAPHAHHVRYLNNFCRKWSVGGGVPDGTWWALKRYHFPLVGSGWLLLLPGGPWMITVIS